MQLIKAGGGSVEVPLQTTTGKKRGRPSKNNNENTAVLTTRVPKKLHSTIKAFAKDNGISSSQFMSELLEADIKRYVSVKELAKEKGLNPKDIILDLFEADIRKIKKGNVIKKTFISIFSKIPYVMIGLLAGLGLAIVVKDVLFPSFMETVMPYIHSLLQ